MANVTITTHDGVVYTDPSQIKIPRNEHTELLYSMLENYHPEKKKQMIKPRKRLPMDKQGGEDNA